MKNYLLIFGMIAALASCVKQPGSDAEITTKQNIFAPQYLLAKDFQVPVVTGKVTVVAIGTDTLAITDVPMTIQIPKGMETKVSAEIAVTYIATKDFPGYEPNRGTKTGVWMLAFEDSPLAVTADNEAVGDCDYNDFVVVVNQEQIENDGKTNIAFTFKPIAMGGTKEDISFGFDLYKDGKPSNETILYNNIRTSFFGGKSGILNTSGKIGFAAPLPSDDPYKSTCGVAVTSRNFEGTGYTVNYFIKVDGNKKLSIAAVTESSRGGKSLPYGLAIPTTPYKDLGYDGVFAYPEENISIFDAYEKFQDWINEPFRSSWYMNPSSEDSDAKNLTYHQIKDDTVVGVLEF